MDNKKPKLHNNFKIDNDNIINKRLYCDNDIEIYELNNKKFLILFLDTKIRILKTKKQKYNIFKLRVTNDNFVALITDINYTENPTLLIEDLTQLKGFDAVAGMQDLKQLLIQDVILPIVQKEKYEKFKISIPNGILLYGPPGCGKTFIVRKLAEELNFTYFEIKHSDVTTPYIHGGVGKIAEVFKMAKLKSPSLIFIDEIDGLLPDRTNLENSQSYKTEEINEFLTHLNDAGKNQVLVIGATNQLELIDKAVLRSGRFDKKIYVMPPDFDARVHLFELYLTDRPVAKIDYNLLSGQTINYSCSDIEYICNEAARVTVASGLEEITEDILIKVIENTKSSI